MQKVRLGDVCTKGSSNIAQKDLEKKSGIYPIYGASGFIKNVDFYKQENEYIALVKDGAGVGRVMKCPEKSSVIGTMQYIFPNDNINISFLAYVLEKMDLSKFCSGATIPHIYFKDYCNQTFLLPSFEQQQQIVSVLDKISLLIDKRKKQLTKLDELVKSCFVEMFGDPIENPFGWTKSTIGECCTLKSGTSLSVLVENEGGSIPYVKVSDMNYPGNERYITTSSRFVSEKTAGNGLFVVGTIIFPKRGGAIGTNKKRMTKLPICADLNVMGVSTKGKLLPEYLFTYFEMLDLGTLSDGSSVPQINNKNIAPLIIFIPPLELQKQFVAFVEQTDKSKLKVQNSLEKLELLKQALMQKYFG